MKSRLFVNKTGFWPDFDHSDFDQVKAVLSIGYTTVYHKKFVAFLLNISVKKQPILIILMHKILYKFCMLGLQLFYLNWKWHLLFELYRKWTVCWRSYWFSFIRLWCNFSWVIWIGFTQDLLCQKLWKLVDFLLYIFKSYGCFTHIVNVYFSDTFFHSERCCHT